MVKIIHNALKTYFCKVLYRFKDNIAGYQKHIGDSLKEFGLTLNDVYDFRVSGAFKEDIDAIEGTLGSVLEKGISFKQGLDILINYIHIKRNLSCSEECGKNPLLYLNSAVARIGSDVYYFNELVAANDKLMGTNGYDKEISIISKNLSDHYQKLLGKITKQIKEIEIAIAQSNSEAPLGEDA